MRRKILRLYRIWQININILIAFKVLGLLGTTMMVASTLSLSAQRITNIILVILNATS